MMLSEEVAPQDNEWEEVIRWHFAIVGLDIQQDEFEIAPGVTLKRINNSPSFQSLSEHLSDPMTIGLVQHYVNQASLRFELVIDTEYLEENISVPELADLVVTAIGVKTESDIICLTTCEESWGSINRLTNQKFKTRIENAPYVPKLYGPTVVSDNDLTWIKENLRAILDLNTDPKFATAFKSFSSQMHCADPRLAVAQTWAGIEALVGGKFQASYSLSLLAALLLEPRGASCEKKRKEIRSLYDKRSDIIHGRSVKTELVTAHAVDARRLLAQLLAKLIELGRVYDDDDIHTLATYLPQNPDDFQRHPLGTPN